MDYLQNHIYCTDSNWGGHYDCRHLVSFNSFEEDKQDWESIIDEKAESITITFMSREMDAPVINLKPHVLKWLEENVEDRKNDPDCNKGWCIGSTKYRSRDCSSLSIFFHRKRDAMKFIKTFSSFKKPIHYCQYFTDVRKKLNTETMKYEPM